MKEMARDEGLTKGEPVAHSDRALPWQIAGRDVRPDALFLSLNTVTSSSAFVLMVGGLALRAAFTALAELDAAIRDAEV